MVFSSLPFLFLFLPLCLVLYFLMPNLKLKNAVLLVMSLVFYSTGEPVYVLLMLLCALVGWASGLLLEKYRERRTAAKVILAVTTVLCLSSLFVFKYLDFVIDNLNLLPFVNLGRVNLTLPIGISFFTFQTLSYDIDLYRGQAKMQKSYWKFLLFVSLFPQLIAGPILRYTDIQEQLDDRKTTTEGFSDGITRFLAGCGKKVLLANALGELVDLLFENGVADVPVFCVWLGVFVFSLQIYFDFSGYSDMAIGLGKMFGFSYGENFNYPYVSRSITDFWRRWHISLGSFFRDYVYIPLGGNRKHQLFNLFAVWALTGLWHGSNWNFLLWGLYFFVLLVIEKFLLKRRLEKIPVLSNLVTLVLLAVGWAIFYFEDFGQLTAALGTMFGFGCQKLWDGLLTSSVLNKLPVLAISVVACLPVGTWVKKKMDALRDGKPGVWFTLTLVYNAAMLFLCTASLVSSSYNPFLYFRF